MAGFKFPFLSINPSIQSSPDGTLNGFNRAAEFTQKDLGGHVPQNGSGWLLGTTGCQHPGHCRQSGGF